MMRPETQNRNETIILDIGIDVCLNCPYDECIGTDTELCHLMKDEVSRVKAEIDEDKQKKDREVLKSIQASVKKTGLTMPELRDIYGYEYGFLQSLMRRGKLEVKREMAGNKPKIVVVGVNF